MNPELLSLHFDRISNAPDAIPRIRRFVLDLAVRGKLVEQDPNDEPASELLRRIQAWRKAAEDQKKIRAPRRPLRAIRECEPPYRLPNGWSWAHLGELIYVHSGDGLTAEAMRSGSIPVFGGNGITGFHDTPNIFQPSIVIGRVGYYCGSIHVTPAQAWVTDNAFITEFPCHEFCSSFLALLLRATNLKENEKATAQPVISGSKIYPIIVGLPPLAEQHRIVSKLDELMQLCKRFETAKFEHENRRDRLAAASHYHLNNGADAEAFRKHSHFFIGHLPRLTARPDQIRQLRQTILNLAVRGKLVEQHSTDEPASQLLKSLHTQRERLVKEGQIKGHKELPPPRKEDAPFLIPSGWQWECFIEVAAIQSNLVDPSKYKDSPHIAPDNIESGTGRLLTFTTVGASAVFSAKHLFFAGCILYSKIRPALAKATMVDFDGLCSADMYPILPFIHRGYLHKYMLSDAFVRQSVSEDNRVAMPKINQVALSKIAVPVPPLAEQDRIVAKVDELMALCDRLEAQLTSTQTDTGRLLEAVLHKALATAVQ